MLRGTELAMSANVMHTIHREHAPVAAAKKQYEYMHDLIGYHIERSQGEVPVRVS